MDSFRLVDRICHKLEHSFRLTITSRVPPRARYQKNKKDGPERPPPPPDGSANTASIGLATRDPGGATTRTTSELIVLGGIFFSHNFLCSRIVRTVLSR